MSSFLNTNLIEITHPTQRVSADISLVSSKSESNRVLIINKLHDNDSQIFNLSTARDTQILQQLLNHHDQRTWNVLDAGTAMRFLTAFCAVVRQQETILTGTSRMQQRPIKILVEALRELGAEIGYLANDGYPPIHIKGFESNKNRISVNGNVSSQYISALLMIAPILPSGLQLELVGKIGSRPYIQMTLDLMQRFGIQYLWKENYIEIKPQSYQRSHYTIESDWSGASYWYQVAALSKTSRISLRGLRKKSYQGDRQIVQIMEYLGVKTVFTETGVQLDKSEEVSFLEYDFSDCPDLAQTVAVTSAMKGVELKMKGLKSLRIKETDRIDALTQEIKKYDIQTLVYQDDELHILPNQQPKPPSQPIQTYQDHRMAMAFAPTALLFDVQIENPKVVQKSYPTYWDDLLKADFQINMV